jgi:anti-sigma regulatory factor (Ser/Thr protein kinase)
VDDPARAGESGGTSRSVTQVFSSDLAEVARARHMVRAYLESWGYVGDEEALVLAVSELVTNALVHGDGHVEVTLAMSDGTIVLEVTNAGVGTEQPRVVPPDARHGRGGWGLHIVERVADEWGTDRAAGRTRVWMQRRAQSREREPDRKR